MRVVRGTDVELRFPLFEDPTASAETPTTPTGLTATAVSIDGTVYTAPAVAGTSEPGVVAATLLSGVHTADVDQIIVNVTGTIGGADVRRRVVVDVVEQPYVWLAEIREELSTDPNGGDVSRFPGWLLEDSRDSVEARVQDYTGRAFARRYDVIDRMARAAWFASPYAPLHEVRTITIGGTVVSPSAVTVDVNALQIPVHQRARVVAGVVWGEDVVSPTLRRHMLTEIRTEVFARGATTPTNAVSESFGGEGPTIRYVLAGEKRPMGSPSFDEYLRSLKTQAIA